MFFSIRIVSDKEEKRRIKLQGWHEHNHTLYNILNEWQTMIVTIYNYHKFTTWFGAYTIALSVFKYKMINNFGIDIIQKHTGT